MHEQVFTCGDNLTLTCGKPVKEADGRNKPTDESLSKCDTT